MKYSNTLMRLTHLATVLYAIIVLINVVLPVMSTEKLNVSLFTIAIIICWTIAVLSANGYIKQVAERMDDCIVYDTIIPLFPATFIRVVQLAWYFLRHRENFKIGIFILDVIFDIVFVAILFADKSNYYYMSVEEDKDD